MTFRVRWPVWLRVGGPLLALALLVSGVLVLTGRQEEKRYSPAASSWRDGSVHGPWRSVFHGYGSNTGGARELTLTPHSAQRRERTHAGLVVSTAGYGAVEYRARMRTAAQLRAGEPNPWEVAWLVWAYRDPEHFYYLALKPNGWELGKRDPGYRGGQRFLATGLPRFPIGAWSRIRVRHEGARMVVEVNGRAVADVTDRERPYTRGSVGAYTEDARAEFRDITVDRRG
ncbi:family 16 glycoside hydrolase [Streptomyces sp. NPDC057638]|uniref:family 16 glycoside hydrolase n=1 Tax=Streptomyces sp. NPDC057638 TaxID=3346190 RepID=UPI00368B958B